MPEIWKCECSRCVPDELPIASDLQHIRTATCCLVDKAFDGLSSQLEKHLGHVAFGDHEHDREFIKTYRRTIHSMYRDAIFHVVEQLLRDKAKLRADHSAAHRYRELLVEVAESAVEFEDKRVRYVTVQIDAGTWKEISALAHGQGEANEA